MSEMNSPKNMNDEERLSHERRIKRERALFLYTCALDQGDLKTIAALYEQAEMDSDLERMLFELNETYLEEMEETVWKQDAGQVRALLAQYLPSAQIVDPAQPSQRTELEEPPALTVNDILARMKTNGEIGPHVRREAENTLQRLQAQGSPLPEDISQRGIARLFQQLGISISRQMEKLFSDTAILLSMGRRQGLAATRLQRRDGRHDASTEEEARAETTDRENQEK